MRSTVFTSKVNYNRGKYLFTWKYVNHIIKLGTYYLACKLLLMVFEVNILLVNNLFTHN